MRLTRRGDGSLYDQVTAGFKANLSDVLAAIALVQLDRVEAHTRDPGAPVRALRRGARRARRASRRSSAIRATRTRCTSTWCGSTPQRRRRHARRLPARARRRADRHEHPLPAGAPPDLVPRALPRPAAPAGRRARRRRGAVAAALARALGRRHPRRRRLPSAACTRGSRHEGAEGPAAVARQAAGPDPDRRHADDASRSPTSCSRSTSTRRGTCSRRPNLWWFALAVAIMIVTALPMAKRWQWLLAAQGMIDQLLVADPRVLRLVHGGADPADLDRRRRGADLRDLEAAPGTVGRPDGDRDHRARPRRRGDGAPRRDRVRARDRPLRRQRLPLARGGVRLRDDRS